MIGRDPEQDESVLISYTYRAWMDRIRAGRKCTNHWTTICFGLRLGFILSDKSALKLGVFQAIVDPQHVQDDLYTLR